MKNKETGKKNNIIFNSIINHRIVFTILAILVYIALTLTICYYVPTDSKTRFNLENLELSAEISSFLFIVISSIIAVWQYYISCRNESIKNETKKIQKSIDLIEYYKDNILDKMNAIELIFKKSGISDILNHVDKSKMQNYDEHELNQLLTEAQVNSLKNIEKSEDFFISILIVDKICNLHLPCNNSEEINKDKTIAAFMSNFISDTLNNLEFFAMHFTHNIADESVIYQSAHQTYLRLTELLYYNIAKNNNINSSKYYTNVIELHNIWKAKQINQQDEIVQGQRGSINKGANASNI